MAKKLSEVKRFNNGPRWDDGVEWFSFPPNKGVSIRLVGDVSVVARHWPISRKGKNMPPVICAQFNPDTEEFDLPNPCCLHDDFGDKAQKVIFINGIVRSIQKSGDELDQGGVRGIALPASLLEEFASIQELIGCELSDPESGVDLQIKNLPQNAQRKWTVHHGKETPLQPHENPADPKCKNKYYNFDALIPDFYGLVTKKQMRGLDEEEVAKLKQVAQKEAYRRAVAHEKELKDSLVRAYYYVRQKLDDIPEDNPYNAFASDKNGIPFNRVPELVEYELAQNSKRANLCSESALQRVKESSLQSEDEVDADDAPVRGQKPKSRKPVVEEDDDFETDDSDEESVAIGRGKKPVDDDDEDEPAPAKKPGKKKPVADEDEDEPAPTKKQTKKPVVEDDDEDEPAPAKKPAAKKPAVDEDDEDEPAEMRRGGKKPAADDDDDDVPVQRGKRNPFASDDDEDEPAPAKKPAAKKPAADEDDEDEPAPAKKPTKKPVVEDDDEDAPAPAKKPKKPAVDEDDEDEPAPAKKPAKKPVDDDEDPFADDDEKPAPAKKPPAKKPVADDDEPAPAKKPKKPVVVNDADEDSPPKVHDDPAIQETAKKFGKHGWRPGCFTEFVGKKKCVKCPSQGLCAELTEE